jgi:MGT family glycosyltransferase
MAIGHHVDSRALGPVPDNFEMHRWVPQFSVLSQADAFVTHAGPAGICEALYHEVPMTAVPQAWDQLRYAVRIAELGVGRHLPREQATAAALREAVLALAGDPDVAARVAKAREEMCQGGGTIAAADLIEQHLRAIR